MESLQPLPYKEVKRELRANPPINRADLAVEIGFLIADGFLAVHSGNLADIESLAANLARYGDGLDAEVDKERVAAIRENSAILVKLALERQR